MREHSTVAEFYLQGVRLQVPSGLLTPTIHKALNSGSYERLEARQVSRFLQDGDRLVEFGAGLGFLSALSSKLRRLDACVVVEANPELIGVIQATHQANGVESHIVNAVALSPQSPHWPHVQDGTLPFYITPNFWGASLAAAHRANRVLRVPVARADELIRIHRPTVIICDIEGGEIDLLEGAELHSVRMAFFEVHKSVIGLAGIHRLAQTLAHHGLYYDPDYSVGATVMYSRA